MVNCTYTKSDQQNQKCSLSQSHLGVHGAVLIRASPLVADFAVATAGAISPGEVSGLADQLSAGLPSAPQLGAGLHVGAGLRAWTKG